MLCQVYNRLDKPHYSAPAEAVEAAAPAAPRLPARPLTLRQERFCQVYVRCPNAARVAGYSRRTAKSQGWRLLRARWVQGRLGQIRAELARDHGHDLEALIGKLEVVYCQAVEDHSAYAAARAVELQARLAGIRARRSAARAAAVAAPETPAAAYDDDELQAMIAVAEAELRRVMADQPRPDDAEADADAGIAERSALVGIGQHAVDIGSTKSRHPGQHPGQHPVDIRETSAGPAPGGFTGRTAARPGP